jgi:hypothetical protein
MHFSKRDDLYQASWISGPRHNCLSVAFAESVVDSEPTIKMLPPFGEYRHNALDEISILSFVSESVAEANRIFESDYIVSRIEYIENDTPPEEIYGYLAFKIIERLFSGGEFSDTVRMAL